MGFRPRALMGLMLAATAVGCLKARSPSDAGGSDVELEMRAQVSGGSTLNIAVADEDNGNLSVPLLTKTVSVSGTTQSVPLTIDLTRCLSDPRHVSVGNTCEIVVGVDL